MALLDYPESDRLEDDFYRPDDPSAVAGKRQRIADNKSRRAASIAADASDDEAPFLRSRRRVPVRKSLIPQSLLGRIALGTGVVLVLGAAATTVYATQSFLRHDPRFRIANSGSIRIVGNTEVSRPDLLAIFGEDIGRNIFFVPLEQRRKQMEALPWIAHATVMRLMPDQLRIAVTERTPVAFVHNRSRAGLVDGEGVLLDMPPKAAEKHYSFPVLTGINAADPLSSRAARMKIYGRFVHDLDATGEHVSAKLSEVDLSDPEDVRAVIADGDRSLLVHFGDENFLERYHGYQAHLAEWRQQYPRLAAVDARYDSQFVLEMAPGKSAPDAATSAPTKSDAAPPAKKPLVALHKPAPKHTKAKTPVKPARQPTLQQLRQQRQMEQR
ncbi:MAG TPA: FtsQ-type POTRA domain-containing protein [Acidobacteriaceae bacterium]|nr:FtsQ-type POTRA domain-containing protein [Acidobacteriaceae bacterium]